MDTIFIRDLSLRTIIGTFPEERREKQDVIINIALRCDLGLAGKSDDLKDTVDYKAVKKRVVKLVEGSLCQLVERLAELVADVCLSEKMVRSVQVSVDKPGALRFARSVAVVIERSRGE